LTWIINDGQNGLLGSISYPAGEISMTEIIKTKEVGSFLEAIGLDEEPMGMWNGVRA
jgi:hypothetical protein